MHLGSDTSPPRGPSRSEQAPADADAGSFAHHLLALAGAQRTGVMMVRGDERAVDIYLKRGTPVFASQPTLSGSLGKTLLDEKLLSPADYERVVSQMTDAVFENEDMCLAEVAVQLGLLSHEEAHTRLEQLVRQTVMGCMGLHHAMVDFAPGDEPLSLVASYPCPVESLVFAGVKRYYDMERTELVWRRDALAFARLSAPPDQIASRHAMRPGERRYIGNIDGTRRISDLIHTGVLDVLHTSQIVAALLLTEGIELFAEPLPLPAPGVVQSAVPDAPPPERVESAASQTKRSSALLRAVRLPAEVTRAERVKAEHLHTRGKRLLRANSPKQALRCFEQARAADSEVPEYALYEEWTRFLLEPPAKPEDALGELASLALRTLQRDRTLAFAHYVRGRVSLIEGDEPQALRAFRATLRLDPDFEEARRFLRALRKREARD